MKLLVAFLFCLLWIAPASAADKKAAKPAAKKAAVKATGEHANYLKKVKTNDETIGVIAGVINYVCPKIVAKSAKVCNVKDPVGSAVGFQKQLGDIDEVDELEGKALKKYLKKHKIIHMKAAMQFYDAVEQFKLHFEPRKKAKALAAKKDWKAAAQHEEMAWQYLVKTASRGIFAKKLVDGE